ncbi:hypothetical protein HG531_012745 [Fusarium graminearum]|nr:hypothetical protein HG531_012745 [Fusarium graminearum]
MKPSLEVDIGGNFDLLGVVLENGDSASNIGQVNIDMSIEASWTSEGLVQHLGQVGGSDDNDLAILIKSVQFGKQLVQCLFGVCLVSRVALASNSIKLVDKDNGRGLVLGGSEELTDSLGTNANKDLVKLTTRHVEERNTGFTGNGSSKKRLTGTGRTNQEDTLGKLGTEVAKLLRVLQKFDDFLEFFLGFIATVDILEPGVLLLSLDLRILFAARTSTTESAERLNSNSNNSRRIRSLSSTSTKHSEGSLVGVIGSRAGGEASRLISFHKNSRHVGSEEKLVKSILRVRITRVSVGGFLQRCELVAGDAIGAAEGSALDRKWIER